MISFPSLITRVLYRIVPASASSATCTVRVTVLLVFGAMVPNAMVRVLPTLVTVASPPVPVRLSSDASTSVTSPSTQSSSPSFVAVIVYV